VKSNAETLDAKLSLISAAVLVNEFHKFRKESFISMNKGLTISSPNTMPAIAEATSSNISVAVRIRPLSTKELNEQSQECVRATSSSEILASGKHGDRVFEFDSVFGPQATQEEVYAGTVGNLIKDILYKGFNGTILAYGQTGSGESRFIQN
jgi:hypothetical protein